MTTILFKNLMPETHGPIKNVNIVLLNPPFTCSFEKEKKQTSHRVIIQETHTYYQFPKISNQPKGNKKCLERFFCENIFQLL